MTQANIRGRIGATPLILLAAIALAFGLWAGMRWQRSPAPPTLTAGILYPSPQALASFELTQADGRPFGLAELKGHWTVAFFGFTHCPDICPTTLATFKQVWAKLPAATRAGKVQFLFVSVDPARDTADKLGAYVKFFSPEFLAASGDDSQLTTLTRSLGLVYARVDDGKGGYSVDHSAAAVIIDPNARRAGLFRPPFDAGRIAADLVSLSGQP